MTDEATPDTGTDATPDAPTVEPDTDTTDWKAEAEKFQALQRKWEERAKANASAAKELETVKAASMSEQEKAVAQAAAEARSATLAEFGGRLAAAEVKVAAAGKLDDQQLTTLLDTVDLTKFLTEDGEVDAERVRAFVDGIAPKPADNPFQPDLGQGARGGTPALGSDPLLQALKNTVGAR